VGVRVRVPATSANLGPGYDTFGLALELYDEFEAALAPAWQVAVSGEGAASLARSADNQVAVAMARAFAETGHPELAAAIECANGIPVGRGLGSSSAAIVGGLMLGFALVGTDPGPERMLALAAEIEGHADNVAAALLGGFTVSVVDTSGARAIRIDPAGGLAAVVAISETELLTVESRGALPSVVPHADAAANGARAALVALGIALGNHDALQRGLSDAIHEPYRGPLVPDLEAVRDALALAGAGAAVLSGAGPTAIALVQSADDGHALERARAVAESARPALADLGRGRVMALGIDRIGARFV
jgi:homoserine kinase